MIKLVISKRPCQYTVFSNVSDLRKVELSAQETKFWRHQAEKPRTYLATIEAIYYFAREIFELVETRSYEGQYDNLLFYFCFMYSQIRKAYNNGKSLKAYKKTETESSVR